MSLEFDWRAITGSTSRRDGADCPSAHKSETLEAIQRALNVKLGEVQGKGFASFIDGLAITAFGLGSCEPTVEIVDISEPLPAFNCGARGQEPPPSEGAVSLQLTVRVSYEDDVHIALSGEACANYPSPKIIVLPLSLTITRVTFKGTLLIVRVLDGAPEEGCTKISLAPIYGSGDGGGDGSGDGSGDGREGSREEEQGWQVDFEFDSEIGDPQSHALRNVSKVETFVNDILQRAIAMLLVYPNFITIPPASHRSST